MASFLDFLIGSGPQSEQVQRFTPQQISALNQLLQSGLGGLSGQLGHGYEPIAQQARTQFQQNTIPSIAERFTSMGGQRSSAFPQILGQAGANLEQGLAADQAQFGLQERNQLLNMLQIGLMPQFDTIQYEGAPGILPSIAQGASAVLPFMLPGIGSALGAGIGALGSGLGALGRRRTQPMNMPNASMMSMNPAMAGAQQGISNVMNALRG